MTNSTFTDAFQDMPRGSVFIVENDPEHFLISLQDKLSDVSTVVYCIEGEGNNELLTKILESAGVPPEKVAVLEQGNEPLLPFKYLQRSATISHCIFFGVDPADAQALAELPYFQVASLHDIQIIRSHTLGQLQEDKQMKGALWAAMKKAYNI